MPKEGSFISFKNFHRSIKVPFVVYADFEAFTEEISSCKPNDEFSFTQKYQKHTPSGFCYKIVGGEIDFKPVLYRAKDNEDISAIFVEMLEKDIIKLHEEFKFSKPMLPLAQKEQLEFDNAEICWICQKNFGKEKKVRDHCHFTGKFRGAAHNVCNLQYKIPNFTPVIFHNLAGYDSHLFVKNLGKNEGNIRCIANNEEKYISFAKEIVVGEYTDKNGKKKEKKHEIRFIDSFKFMASSLGGLVENLEKSDITKFIQTKKEFGEKTHFMVKKGIYPYDYMNKLENFSEENLPPKKHFIHS